MSHYCRETLCTIRIPNDHEYCPKHELRYGPSPQVREYLEGLQGLADNIGTLIAGSKLNSNEIGALSFIQGYLNAAKSHLQKEVHEPVQS